ncbi:BCNT-domain-containing protein [Hyaloscypha variabilis F]|uniref:SWR1-complex protein 5 n=1 Tax=Hyaloscypha variabilis (strain UAMH 11265 / GT02V1 / F) TaxID=1149755 RepID=A0A2J6RE19_HYAVF|nr:BCNT-domain-containing protein [Hyaloscypha variabilis F]
MPPEIIPSDSDYASEEDSDFAPDAAPAVEAESSDSESEADEPAAKAQAKPKSKKRKRGDEEEAEDVGFENSGDEAIIKEYEAPKRKKGKKGRAAEEDEGGEGGFVKTRSMRAVVSVEKKKTLVDISAATIDVDAVWNAMVSGKPLPSATVPVTSIEAPPLKSPLSPTKKQNTLAQEARKDTRSPSTLNDGPDSMIMIKRTYFFAGKTHTEQKLVARNSAEAKLYLASLPENAPPAPPAKEAPSPFSKPKRPAKKARRSVFEPVPPEGWPKRHDLHFGERKESDLKLSELGKEKGKKLNTVEKSAMDWAGFVDKEGIKDDLDAAGKSKGAYRARQEFLARVQQKKDEDERRARGLPV